MKLVTKILVVAVLGSLIMSFGKHSKDQIIDENDPKKELSHFPAAKEGMVRYVIFLDKKSNEDLYKVELIPGKVMNVDCNIHRLIGKTEEKDLEGWGYTYFEFSSEGNAISTRKGCPNQTNSNKFISSESMMVRYNSKLPIVVYAPKGYEIKYKIWEAGKLKNSSAN
ncbi:serine protease inhibitor ecotin [Apibacter raozihei]|uniref:serine protease inhibitor ecotin n=1 Tax=Apibacter raozihei TaxID=2500547 RepID=UPI000FE393C0|nr:serine protease inhibitor ecotin [Apibacter raozihei]